jgi:hypothetical protein
VSAALWRHEMRRAGWTVLLAPLLTAAAGGLIVLATVRSGGGPETVSVGLGYVLEMGVPLAVGVATTTLVGRDPVLELQLSVPVGYRVTLLRRAAIALAAGALVALLVDAVRRGGATIRPAGQATWPSSGTVGLVVWLAPTVALVGLGLLVAAILRDPPPAAGVVVTGWLFEELAPDRVPGPVYLFASTEPFTGDWLANRLTLIAVGAVAVAAAWPQLGRPSLLLTAPDAG